MGRPGATGGLGSAGGAGGLSDEDACSEIGCGGAGGKGGNGGTGGPGRYGANGLAQPVFGLSPTIGIQTNYQLTVSQSGDPTLLVLQESNPLPFSSLAV